MKSHILSKEVDGGVTISGEDGGKFLTGDIVEKLKYRSRCYVEIFGLWGRQGHL